jgi:hypothetical protein
MSYLERYRGPQEMIGIANMVFDLPIAALDVAGKRSSVLGRSLAMVAISASLLVSLMIVIRRF